MLYSLGGRGTKKTQVRNFSQEELKKRLTPLQYRVTQEKGTERSGNRITTSCLFRFSYISWFVPREELVYGA